MDQSDAHRLIAARIFISVTIFNISVRVRLGQMPTSRINLIEKWEAGGRAEQKKPKSFQTNDNDLASDSFRSALQRQRADDDDLMMEAEKCGDVEMESYAHTRTQYFSLCARFNHVIV